MDTMEMITKALEAVVEQKIAEKATTVNLDSVLEFIKNADREVLNEMLMAIGDTSIGSNLIKDIVDREIENNFIIVFKSDLTVSDVDDIGLLDNAGNLRYIAKDIIDRI